MSWILLTVTGFNVGALGFAIYGLHRNKQVYTYRKAMNEKIFARPDWHDLLKIHMGVDYDDMVRRFWKPLDSFYPKEFLEKLETAYVPPSTILTPYQTGSTAFSSMIKTMRQTGLIQSKSKPKPIKPRQIRDNDL